MTTRLFFTGYLSIGIAMALILSGCSSTDFGLPPLPQDFTYDDCLDFSPMNPDDILFSGDFRITNDSQECVRFEAETNNVHIWPDREGCDMIILHAEIPPPSHD